MIRRFKKVEPEIEAVLWDGSNLGEIQDFVGMFRVRCINSWDKGLDNTLLVIDQHREFRVHLNEYLLKDDCNVLGVANELFISSYKEITKGE